MCRKIGTASWLPKRHICRTNELIVHGIDRDIEYVLLSLGSRHKTYDT